MLRKGKLFIISAPSGCGKTTLCKKLLEEFNETAKYSISYTTRKPRANEIDGKDYFFVDKKKFLNMVENREFLEWADVYGDYYGTSKNFVKNILSEQRDVIMDIDPNGAFQIKNKISSAILIMILPPSIKELERRLRNRNTESEEKLALRIKSAKKEVMNYKRYDYFVVNDIFDRAYEELSAIYIAEHCKIQDIEKIENIINMEV
ncbi:MAG: guanylate kinase [Deferribacterota bacterium]|nr:guanylate kinase [Deferribacterota bacterium]